jgi:hypothetical protein
VEYLTLENFLWLQAALVVVGITYLLRRGSRTSAQFRWRERVVREAPTEMTRQSRMWNSQPAARSRGGPVGTVMAEGPLAASVERDVTPERNLNVHFNFNGHSWDAYEVLGLPAGSSSERVEAAFTAALERSEPSSREFFEMARDAIRKSLGK